MPSFRERRRCDDEEEEAAADDDLPLLPPFTRGGLERPLLPPRPPPLPLPLEALAEVPAAKMLLFAAELCTPDERFRWCLPPPPPAAAAASARLPSSPF